MRKKFVIPALLIGVVLIFGVAVYGFNLGNPLAYRGDYVDLITQERAATPPSSGLMITKVDRKTGYALATTSISGYGPFGLLKTTDCYPKFMYEGEPMQLHFRHNVLVGCRRYASMSLEEQLKNEWESDEITLKAVLADYAAQVRALP